MTKYSKEFKEEALKLSDEIGNKKAASQLGIPYYTLADWRNKSKHTAINLAQSDSIAVFPVVGWWRERTTLKKYNSKVRYSLIVTIETPEEQVDLYTPIMTKIASRITVPVTTP